MVLPRHAVGNQAIARWLHERCQRWVLGSNYLEPGAHFTKALVLGNNLVLARPMPTISNCLHPQSVPSSHDSPLPSHPQARQDSS